MTDTVLRLWQSMDTDDPFEALFLAAPIMLHSVGKDGRFLRVSRFWADKLGHRVEDMLGQPIVDFLTEESRSYAEQVTIPGFRQSGQADAIEYDYLCKDGRILPVVTSAIAEYDDHGDFLRSLAVSFDNSKSKQIAQELRQKTRVDAIGELVGGVAHDFNNLLAVVQGNLDFLRRDPDDPDRDELIKDAVDATKRGGSLIEQLLRYGHRGKPSISQIDVKEVIETAQRLVRRLFPSNIDIEITTARGLWHAHADAALLETALLNILNNARDAMPRGGRITIDARNAKIKDTVTRHPDAILPGRYVMISISDTGHGMDPALLSKIFDPFVTTKTQGRGSGLGLSMVMGFMKQSKGTVRVESEPGMGTTFRLLFPCEVIEISPIATEHLTHRTLQEEKKILIVEDDSSVRSVLARQLKDDKIKVFEAETGDGAFKAMDSGLQPDLLLTDIVMPGALQGPDLVQKARAILPDLRVLFISGYPPGVAQQAKDIAPSDPQLTKPASQERLVAAVMDLLVDE